MDAVGEAGYPLLCGLPGGGTSLDLIEAAPQAGCRFLPTATESGSVMIAATIADITGKAAAVTTTLGPGVTSAVNGIACASLDRLAVLVITDDYEESGRERFRRQNIDASRLLAGLMKTSLEITDASPEAATYRALDIAHRAPAGPVHLALPASTARRTISDAGHTMPRARDEAAHGFEEQALTVAAELLGRSSRPLILAGAETRSDAAASALVRLAGALAAPVLTTYRGKGSLPEDHPLSAGLFTNGTLERELLEKADLLIGAGLDPVELLPRDWVLDAPFIQAREAPDDRPLIPPSASMIGPLEPALTALAHASTPSSPSWAAQAAASRARTTDRLQRAITDAHRGDGLAPTRVVEIAREAAPRNTVATMDSGAHMLAAAALWQTFEPRTFLCSSGLATMGFAIPSSIGAGIACPSRPIVAFVGDAGFLMSTPELGTLAGIGATIVVVVFADSTLSLIELKLNDRVIPRGALATPPVQWEQLAAAFGIHAVTVTTEPALAAAMATALTVGRPSVIVARVDPSSYPRISEVFRG
jgi:acetolactate synthase-1/2/3 large subunit